MMEVDVETKDEGSDGYFMFERLLELVLHQLMINSKTNIWVCGASPLPAS